MDAPLSELLDFLRYPSVSTDAAYAGCVAECAEWLCEKFQSMGLVAELHRTPGHPVVVARNAHRPGRRTVMIYGHYDVQPVDPLELWTSPPFEPRIENGILFARGATDNKGQIMAHIQGVAEILKRDGDLPVNLIFLVEGEEEIGSPNLGKFLHEHKDELRCDVIAISDTGMVGPGIPTLTYGLRGIACLEIKVTGPAIDLHSGIYGGAVANPITALARILATLHDADGHVAIDGFYDDVRPLQPWEKEAWAKLPAADSPLLEQTGVPELFGETGFDSRERLWARPTAEINGIGGGYQGEGSKTVIPSSAFAKLTFRLVPDQKPETVIKQVRAHLARVVPPGVRLEIEEGHVGEAYLMDPNSVFGQAAQRAAQRTFGSGIALIREGGSIPIVNTFREVLGVETLLLGLALPDCRAHSPNENFPLENYRAGIRLNQALLEELSVAG
jgi:acetylornithine deacetylase/succinyl-diaminopimelate desuccinylase-like protein